VANLNAEFKVSSFNRSRDMEGSQNSKSRSRDPITPPLTNFAFFSLGPPLAILCAKFEVFSYNRFRDIEGPNILKLGHVTLHGPL